MILNEFKEIIKETERKVSTEDELIDIVFKMCWKLKFDFETTYHICRFASHISNNKIEDGMSEGKMISCESLNKIYEYIHNRQNWNDRLSSIKGEIIK